MSQHPSLNTRPAVGLAPRRFAWEILEVVAAGGYADVALDRVMRGSTLSVQAVSYTHLRAHET